jgi:hypothetical protein
LLSYGGFEGVRGVCVSVMCVPCPTSSVFTVKAEGFGNEINWRANENDGGAARKEKQGDPGA